MFSVAVDLLSVRVIHSWFFSGSDHDGSSLSCGSQCWGTRRITGRTVSAAVQIVPYGAVVAKACPLAAPYAESGHGPPVGTLRKVGLEPQEIWVVTNFLAFVYRVITLRYV